MGLNAGKTVYCMHTKTWYKYIPFALFAAIAVIAVFLAFSHKITDKPVAQNAPANSSIHPRGNDVLGQVLGASTETTIPLDENPAITPVPKLLMPIQGGLARVTKKPFGLYVTPSSSPVSDDIFTGYHTGVDFESFPNEQNTDVTVTAACDGKVQLKKWANGYGGVLAQACKIDGLDVTIIYGHLKLQSIIVSPGQTLRAGNTIGLLGQGFSQETDGRRKHLHFDIHKGSAINILGYVQSQDDLANWIDPMQYLK